MIRRKRLSKTGRTHRPRGGMLVFALVLALLLSACGDAAIIPVKETVSLDLSNTGLSDVTELLTRTDLTKLDLRGNPVSIEQYDALAAALPDCDILWSVPLGTQRVDNDAASAVLSCAASELETALAYLPKLNDVKFTPEDADAYASLIAFAENHPQMKVRWDVSLGGEVFPQDTVSVDLTGAEVSASALEAALSGLPVCGQVLLGESSALTAQEQLALTRMFPNVAFFWSVPLLADYSVSSTATEIDLRGHSIPDAAAFSDALSLLPNLTYADLCGCGLTDEEMIALRTRYPAAKFVWLIRVGGWEIRTDIKGFSTGQRHKFPDGAGGFVGEKHSYRSFRSSDFEKLTLCTDLVALDVGHCTNIGDVDFIARLPKLKYLVLSLCDIKDISPLKNQTDLEFVEIKYNYIKDLSPLAACTKIRFLNCSNNEISDFSVVKDMPDLERLWMSMNDFTLKQADELRLAMPDTVIKASLRDPEFAESLWRKGNEGYIEMQALFGLRAQNQGAKAP